MKKLAILLSLIFAISCSNESETTKKNAVKFLNAYINYDYNTVSTLCTPEMSEKVKKSIDDFNNLQESVKKFIKEECSKLTPQITSIEQVGKSDTVIINYKLVKFLPDSTTQTAINSSLKMANGKVFQLNN